MAYTSKFWNEIDLPGRVESWNLGGVSSKLGGVGRPPLTPRIDAPGHPQPPNHPTREGGGRAAQPAPHFAAETHQIRRCWHLDGVVGAAAPYPLPRRGEGGGLAQPTPHMGGWAHDMVWYSYFDARMADMTLTLFSTGGGDGGILHPKPYRNLNLGKIKIAPNSVLFHKSLWDIDWCLQKLFWIL